MADVTFKVDGKTLTAPAGALLIDVCRKAGIEIPAFCYYPGLSLQAACRMCVVREAKVRKLLTACTTTVAEGLDFITESEEIAQARAVRGVGVVRHHFAPPQLLGYRCGAWSS